VKTEFFRTSGQPLTPDQAQVLALTEKVRALLVANIPKDTNPDRVISTLVSNIGSIVDSCYDRPIDVAEDIARVLVGQARELAALTPAERERIAKEQS
jgi:hypothetical protein